MDIEREKRLTHNQRRGSVGKLRVDQDDAINSLAHPRESEAFGQSERDVIDATHLRCTLAGPGGFDTSFTGDELSPGADDEELVSRLALLHRDVEHVLVERPDKAVLRPEDDDKACGLPHVRRT